MGDFLRRWNISDDMVRAIICLKNDALIHFAQKLLKGAFIWNKDRSLVQFFKVEELLLYELHKPKHWKRIYKEVDMYHKHTFIPISS